MHEAKRFLRYVTPGLVLLVLVYLYCLILKPDETWCALTSIRGSAAQVIAALAAAGGIGYVVQALHHALLSHVYKRMPSSWELFVDHQAVLDTSVQKKWLVIEPTPQPVSPFAAATACSVILEMNRTAPNLEKAADRVDRLWDLLHSVGSAVVASLLAPVAAMVCVNRMRGIACSCSAKVAFAIMSILIFLAVLANYRILVKFTGAVTCATLLTYLSARKKSTKRALTIQYPVNPERRR